MKLIEKIKKGTATFDDFEDAVNAWHKSASSESVEDYLGISKEDYFAILKNPEVLKKLANKYRIAGSFLEKMKEKHT
jgi:hypothetical protein